MQDVFEWLLGFVMSLFGTIANFFIGFLPDADPGVMSAISSWGSAMSGYGITFNVFYFIDGPYLTLFFSAMIAVMIAGVVYMLLKTVFNVGKGILEAIPFIE